MRKNVMRKNLRQSILRSLGRYVAIVAIIALGAGLFVGLLATKTDMIATGQKYMDGQNMFDLRLLNPYGWTQKELDAIRQMDGVADAEGHVSLDVIAHMGEEAEDTVYQFHEIPEAVNKVYLLGGRMPEAPNECLADGFYATDALLGQKIYVSDANKEDTRESLTYEAYTVVGYVSTPLFIDMSRGNTTLGNGSISAYLYIPADGFAVDYFTQIDITIPGEYAIYSDAYHDAADAAAEELKPLLLPLARERYRSVLQEAEQAYADGQAEYQKGLEEYEKGKLEAQEELEKARKELEDAQTEIEDNEKTLADGEKQLEDAAKLLDDNAATLTQSAQSLAEAKADAYAQLAQGNAELLENYKTVTQNRKAVEDGIAQIDDGLAQIDSGISQLESGLNQLDMTIQLTDTLIGALDTTIDTTQKALDRAKENGSLDAETIASLETRLQEAKDKRAEYAEQKEELVASREAYGKQLEELKVQRQELADQKAELESAKKTLDDALLQIDQGFLEMQNAQTQADNQFAAAEAQLEAGKYQLETARAELEKQTAELEKGRAALEDGKKQLEEGWTEYNKGKEEADKQLADGLQELQNAEQELKDAREQIDSMTEPEVYALGRTTNVGYLALDNNSDIVAGVSRVFPAFFLLVASLVCITTMTRMVEEERTQIGTLKALGYSNWAIISKYLFYAGSAAVVGCGLGVFVGSIIFPNILWAAYSIILSLTPDITIVFDVPLCLAVLVVYTVVICLVTWYCCRMALREVPAELIRPKAPTTGKKIFLEYLPFWNKISFLNKVMLRNIFRYRQRLLMMLVGIGGCTALLVTGFGIGDSIMDIVSYQFQEVTTYDMQVQFGESMDSAAQQKFRDALEQEVEQVGFAHQSSVELDFDDAVRNVYMLAADRSIEDFIDLHSGSHSLHMPDTGQALVSVGVAEAMGIEAGDTILVRNSDMESLTLTVAEVFDNNVNNYVIVTPETVQEQWGSLPEVQVAYINVRAGQDVHEVGAKVSGLDGVMSVMISQDMADQVGSMLDALHMVVATVVVCAGLLAVIVLYNLTNINITERLREIATIKVLGFRSGESAAYVFKENLLLSAMGCVLGLFAGKLLLNFVMSQIRIDMVWMQARILPISLLWSVVITMLMACLVDFFLYFKLEKINMAEALKSVE